MPPKSPPDELQPLRELCRAGRLFDVQEWIRHGNPVALKVLPPPRKRRNGPLCIAMERGFHSLVQVLLEAGAPIKEGNYHALFHAVELKRLDLVKLLLKHGAKVTDVSMQTVIATWDREMVDFFIANGASLVDDNPIAYGLIGKIKMCLGLLKQYAGKQPELMKQADIALRYFVGVGNPKWVALMLWVGADPWTSGPDNVPDWDMRPFEEPEYAYHYNAVQLAVSRGHVDILKQKRMLTPPDPKRPESQALLENDWILRDVTVLKLLIEKGHTPVLYKDKCSGLITRLLCEMSNDHFDPYYIGRSTRQNRDIDTFRASKNLEMVGMLLAAGARWAPRHFNEVTRVRQSLMKMAPKYTYDFVQMVHDHQAACRRDVEELVRTQPMVLLLKKRSKKIPALIGGLPEDLSLVASKG